MIGRTFHFAQLATVDPLAGWSFLSGFFTQADKADLFGYHPSNGTLWVGKNTGAGFSFAKWATVAPAPGWQFVAGDFTGTGRTDIVGYHPNNGTLWLFENTGTAFNSSQWATVDPIAGWQFASGFFTGHGKADIFGYHPSNGTLWVGENVGGGFKFWKWGTVDPAPGWQFIAGSFDADLWVDVVGYHPSNGTLWLAKSTSRPIEGYCWPLSAAPGESISFYISGDGPSSAVFSRHISMGTNVTDIQMDTLNFASSVQVVAPMPWRSGCGWNQTFQLRIPNSWTSGIYTAACADATGNKTKITFVVKAASASASQLLVLANVNTWLAYNGWGGRSKYDGAARVSFMRPNPVASPVASMHLTRGELWPLGWLEQESLRPDVCTDIDFHNGMDFAPYRCVLLTTHPEYWSLKMYDNLLAYLDGGGSVLYLAGNGLFEDGEYEVGQQTMVFRNGIEDGPREDALFRVLNPPRPELSVLGLATERCGVSGSPFEVLQSDHFCFAGSGLVNGSIFGDAGLNTGSISYGNGKASAWEVDTSDGPGALRIPGVREGRSCDMDDRPVSIASPPAGLAVVAQGQFDGVGRGADMTYYDHPGGGFVFSAGSITFCGSLVIDPVIQLIIRNVLARARVL